jgi:hypothetical protein
MGKSTSALIVLLSLLGSPLAFALQGEYHWTICETSPAAVKKQLGADVVKSKRRYLYYLDTKERALYRSGVILRARGESGEAVEMTVKLTTQPASVPKEFRDEKGFKCEADYRARNVSVHCSLEKEKASQKDLKEVLNGKAEASSLFTKSQLRYLEAFRVKIPWREIKAVGPIDDIKWEMDTSAGALDMEYLTAPSGAKLLEISAKEDEASPGKFQRLTSALSSRGVRFCPKQMGIASWALGVD